MNGESRTALSPLLQTILGGSLLIGCFVLGFFVGASKTPYSPSGQQGVAEVVLKLDGSSISLKGIPNERVECLEWVTKNFESPTVLVYTTICGGESPLSK